MNTEFTLDNLKHRSSTIDADRDESPKTVYILYIKSGRECAEWASLQQKHGYSAHFNWERLVFRGKNYIVRYIVFDRDIPDITRFVSSVKHKTKKPFNRHTIHFELEAFLSRKTRVRFCI